MNNLLLQLIVFEVATQRAVFTSTCKTRFNLATVTLCDFTRNQMTCFIFPSLHLNTPSVHPTCRTHTVLTGPFLRHRASNKSAPKRRTLYSRLAALLQPGNITLSCSPCLNVKQLSHFCNSRASSGGMEILPHETHVKIIQHGNSRRFEVKHRHRPLQDGTSWPPSYLVLLLNQ